MSKASKNTQTTNLIVAYGGSILKDSAIYPFFTNDDYQTAFNALLDEKFYKDSSGKLFKIKMSKEEAEQKFNEDDFFNQHKRGDFICCNGITNFVNNAKTLYDVKSAKFINHTEFVKPVKAKKAVKNPAVKGKK